MMKVSHQMKEVECSGIYEMKIDINKVYVIIRKLYFTLYIMFYTLLIIRVNGGIRMEKTEKRWLWILVGMMFLAYFVPFVLLRNVDAWYGSFLFWVAIAFVIIICNVCMTIDWSDET